MTSRIEPLLTIADLEAMPEDDGNRYELIEGELFVSRSPGLTHQIVSDNILYLFRSFLDKEPIGTVVTTIGLILSNYSGVIPDLVFFKRESTRRIVSGERLTSAPELVIEILSPGSANIRRDRVAKHRLYGKYHVPEYWLVDRDEKRVEIYRLHESELELHAILESNDVVTTPVLPGFSCLVEEIFRLPPEFEFPSEPL